jgi:hypothetical protein
MALNIEKQAQRRRKHGFVWLIIAGPAAVVVASFVTFYLAVSRPNEIVTEVPYQSVNLKDQSIEARRNESSLAPAMLGRNHAATGIVPVPPVNKNKP